MTTIEVTIPRPHSGQISVLDGASRFNVIMCGRRFGKTTLGQIIALEQILQGKQIGWFAPTFKYSADVWRFMSNTLKPIIIKASKMEQRLEFLTGGLLEVWSVDNPDSGRGKKYDTIIIDEAGIIRDLEHVWQGTLRPTLTDLKGSAWFLGTPKGRGYFHRLFSHGIDGRKDWSSWRLPTLSNPYMDKDEVESARADLPPEIFAQEYEGVPADDGGCPFNLKAIGECIAPLTSNEPMYWGIDLAKSQDYTVAVGLDENGSVCRLERWQSDWRSTERRLSEMIGETYALVDSTGVGDPVLEQLQANCPLVEGFKFTSQSKQQIMEGLTVAIQTRQVTFPDGWLRNELEIFEYNYTRTGVRYEAPQGMHDDGVCALALALHGQNIKARTMFSFKVL